MEQQSSSPVTEAITILDEVVRDCGVGDPELKSVLRRCQYAAHLVGDSVHADLWRHHIGGFPEGVDIPSCRVVVGTVHWRTSSVDVGEENSLGSKADQVHGTFPARKLYANESIDQLMHWSIKGMARLAPNIGPNSIRSGPLPTIFMVASPGSGDRRAPRPRSEGPEYNVYAWEIYPSTNFDHALAGILQDAYEWAMTTVARLKYEDRVSGIWERVRQDVDANLPKLGLSNHLLAVDRQLGSSNPEEWRSAPYSCRNILRDVAEYLWRVPGRTTKLPDADGKMKDCPVDSEHYVTRLNAYLFYRTRSGSERRLTHTEAELLGELMGRVNTLDNNAHAKVDRELAESAVLHTYIVLSDLIRLTDMVPLASIDAPTS